MTREQAGERFAFAWGAAALASGTGRLLDLPAAVDIGMAVVVLGAVVFYGCVWLRLAGRDGTIRRELVEYGWAFFSLIVIVAASAALTCLVLLVAGRPVTGNAVGTGTAIGLVVSIAGWLALSGRGSASA